MDEVFVDRGESAKTADRTELRRALEYCRRNKGRIGLFIVYAVSRFARQQYDHHTIRAMLTKYGVSLRSVTEPIDDSPTGKAMEGMLSVFAQLDNDIRADRTRVGMRDAMREGRWVHRPPLGYSKPPRHLGPPSLEVDPETGPLIQMAFKEIATGRVGVQKTVELVTAAGLRGRNGKPVTEKRLRALLQKPVYIGVIESKAGGFRAQGDFDPIVSEDVFEHVQAVLRGRAYRKASRRRVREEFPLKSVLRCIECERPITGSFPKGNGGRYGYYRCPKNHVKARYEQVHNGFLTHLERMQPRQGLMKLFREVVLDVWRNRHEESRRVRSTLQARLDALQTRKDRLTDRYLDDRVPEGTYQEQLDRLTVLIGDTRLKLADAQAEELDVEGVLDFAEHALRNAARLWQGFEVRQRIRFQALLFPNGLPFDGEKFGTTKISPVFQMLEPATNAPGSLASPGGFEPPLPA